MDSYWAIYDKHFHAFVDKNNFYFGKNDGINELYNRFVILFPCDDYSSIAHISLLLYFYNRGKTYNNFHSYILGKLEEDISYNNAKYLVNNLKKQYNRVLKAIQRKSFSPKRTQNYLEDEKNASICVESIKIVQDFVKKNDLTKSFQGNFIISRPSPSPSGSRRKSVRDNLPNINAKDLIKFVSQYDAHEYELLYEVWVKMIKEKYPKKVCVSEISSELITTLPNHRPLTNEEFEGKARSIERVKIDYNMQPEQNLFIPIDELLKCKESTFLCTLGINYDNTLSDHANSLVFDKKNKCIYRFEPHGVDEFTDDIIKNELINYPQLNDFEYIGTNKTCPYSRHGVQAIEGLLNNVNKRPEDLGGAGFCFIWSLIYLEYVIHNNDISPNEIHNYLIHEIDDLTQLMYTFTYRLLERYHQMILDDYPFRDKNYTPLLKFKKLDLEMRRDFFGYEYRSGNLDVENDENLERLYKQLYSGNADFNDIMKLFFNDLPGMIFETKLNNIQKMLKALFDVSLYDKLRELNYEYMRKSNHKYILDHFLPRTISYYKDIVKNSFQEYIKVWGGYEEDTTNAFNEYYETYFGEPLF